MFAGRIQTSFLSGQCSASVPNGPWNYPRIQIRKQSATEVLRVALKACEINGQTFLYDY
jgi:hypothetical protein